MANTDIMGTIMLYTGAKTPKGWLDCDGTMLQRLNYPHLFHLIGYRYGSDTSQFFFALPNLPKVGTARYIICESGQYYAKGQIALFIVGEGDPPEGWVYCDGRNGTPDIPDLVDTEHEYSISYLMATRDHEKFYVGFIYPTVLEVAPYRYTFCDGQMLDKDGHFPLLQYVLENRNVCYTDENTYVLPKLEKFKSGNTKNSSDNNYIHYLICTGGDLPGTA